MDTVKFATSLNKNRNVCTSCSIVRDGEVISTGMVTLYAKDTYDKILGQKLALTEALSSVKREERKPLWDWFFNHSKLAKKRYVNLI